MKWPLIFLLSAFSALSYGHGGGLDSYGCHNNRREASYQCHDGANAGKTYSSKEEMLRSIGAQSEPSDHQQSNLEVIQGKVVTITDGDTATILMNNTQYKIRLAEIDTPERAQPYGSKSKEILSGLIFGKEVTAKVQDRDRYGRYVARLYQGEVDVSREMVQQGAAWVYQQYLRDQSLLLVEQEARDAKRGLWSLPESQNVPPWKWRSK